jgi:putative nucleotidyltransferase with HDIG domain
VADLRSAIEKDQSLTAKLLKTVNSAYYGFHRKVGNVDRAIVVLGFNEIINLTLAACIIQEYNGSEDRVFNHQQFWIHALGAAYIARTLAARRPELNAKDAFVIGLLHDFGKVALDQHFHKLFADIITAAAREHRPLHGVESERLFIDHAEIGAIIAESWKLPQPLVKAIQYHHSPELGHGHPQEIALAHLANYYCHNHQIGNSGNPAPDKPRPECLAVLGIAERDLEEVWQLLGIDEIQLRTLL